MINQRTVNGSGPRPAATNTRLINGSDQLGAVETLAILTGVKATRTVIWGVRNSRAMALRWGDPIRINAVFVAGWSATNRIDAAINAAFSMTTANPVSAKSKATWTLLPDR